MIQVVQCFLVVCFQQAANASLPMCCCKFSLTGEPHIRQGSRESRKECTWLKLLLGLVLAW